jgi:hypothetical protein
VIADAHFGAPCDGVRPLRFVPRSSIPLEAACMVANAIRETLHELFGEPCELVVGEPAALRPGAWTALAHDALLFLTRGRQTDIVLVIPRDDARRLVLRGFGEPDDEPAAAWACSTLEARAIERIAARCASAFDPLCAERRSPSRPIVAAEAPACTAYFDVRVQAPVTLALGVGIVRELPDPGPSGRLTARALSTVALNARAVAARRPLDARTFVSLVVGGTLVFDASLDAATLEIGNVCVARSVAGSSGGRAALRVEHLANGPAR